MPPELNDDDRWLGIKELVEYSTLTAKTIRRHLVGRHPIPHYRVGGRILVKRSEFDEWVKQYGSVVTPEPSTTRSELSERVAAAVAGIREGQKR